MENLAARLEGELVVLEPLDESHAEGLWEAAQAPETWAWLTNLGADRDLFERWMRTSIEANAAGSEGVLATRRRADRALVGSTRFMNVRPEDRVVEIGWTWLTPGAWGNGVNVEAKLLMLGHAFEQLECNRVELKTDARNARSRGAMEALPAHFEGILRKHMIVPGVGVRDTAYFSVLDEEWPAVRANLERRLA